MKSIIAGSLISIVNAGVTSTTPIIDNINNNQITEYSCYVCTVSVEHARVMKEASISAACQDLFGTDGSYICNDISMLNTNINTDNNDADKIDIDIEPDTGLVQRDARDVCVDKNICLSLDDETWRKNMNINTISNININTTDTNSSTNLQSNQQTTQTEQTQSPSQSPIDNLFIDIRVAKGYGSKGYDKVRISAISNHIIETDFFTYNEPFQYRWTDYVLNTGVVSVTPGVKSTYRIGNEVVVIDIPLEDAPTRGIIYADPCFSNEFVW